MHPYLSFRTPLGRWVVAPPPHGFVNISKTNFWRGDTIGSVRQVTTHAQPQVRSLPTHITPSPHHTPAHLIHRAEQ